jgi:hypothetical protein
MKCPPIVKYSGAAALLASLDVQIVNTFQNTEYCKRHCKVSEYLSDRFTIDHWDIVRGGIYNRYILNVDTRRWQSIKRDPRCSAVSSVSACTSDWPQSLLVLNTYIRPPCSVLPFATLTKIASVVKIPSVKFEKCVRWESLWYGRADRHEEAGSCLSNLRGCT